MVLGCIANEGYINRPNEVEEYCILNRNQHACTYAVTMGTLCFLCSTAFLALDVYFPQISSVNDRKKAVMVDIGVSGETLPPLVTVNARFRVLICCMFSAALWSLVWFVGFCFLANQWQVSKEEDNPLNEGADAARATIVFSFFSVFTWVRSWTTASHVLPEQSFSSPGSEWLILTVQRWMGHMWDLPAHPWSVLFHHLNVSCVCH